MKKFLKFLVESKEELFKVVWPTKKEATQMTVAVLVIVFIVGLYLGTVDYFLNEAIEFLLK